MMTSNPADGFFLKRKNIRIGQIFFHIARNDRTTVGTYHRLSRLKTNRIFSDW